MRQHIKYLAYLYVAVGVLGLLVAAFVFTVLIGVGALSGEAGAFATLSIIGTVVALFISVLSVPNLLLAYGLFKRKPWARLGGFILGFLNLFNAPLGTILGVYTFWVLLQDESQAILEGRSVPRRA